MWISVPDAVQPVLIVAGLAGMVVGMRFGIALVRDASGLGRRVYWVGSEVGLTLLLVGMQTTVLTTLAALGFSSWWRSDWPTSRRHT